MGSLGHVGQLLLGEGHRALWNEIRYRVISDSFLGGLLRPHLSLLRTR